MKISKHGKKHISLVLLIIGIIGVLAVLDIFGAKMWAVANGGVEWEGSYLKAQPLYEHLFWIFASLVFVCLALGSYVYRRDFSELVALLITPFILISTGLEDLFFYLFKGLPLLTEKLTWLGEHKLVSIISSILGFEVVTGVSLIISVVIGLIVIIILNYVLYKYKG